MANPSSRESSQTTSDQDKDSSSPSNNPIRHAGRALVRGKFRRVWRPRYLEVRDNGLLSYYECPTLTPSSALDVFMDPATMADGDTIEEEDDQYHSKIPKCTLWIHHARIIDPTTLRDMHVGLPRGSYGFLFHGHRMDDEDGDLLQDGLQLLGMGQLQSCQGNTMDATPRDFLCAVNSLEEAQSWVIALQWAASVGRDASYHASLHAPYNIPMNGWDEDGMSLASSFASTPQHSQTKPESPEATKSGSKKKQSSPSSSRSAGKMVVAKVVGYTLVRQETWKWEIAYQISVLLIMHTKEQRQVQEWSILRTAQNLEAIADKLKVFLPAAISQKMQPQMELIHALPRLQSRRSLSELPKSVPVVNDILRSFCLEATVVDSSVLKRFLGVHGSSKDAVTQNSPFWDLHNPAALRTRPKLTILRQSIDQYVKQWLQQPKERPSNPPLKFRVLCWYLRLPQPATTCTGAALLSLWFSSSTLPMINRFIGKFQIIPYVSIRLDALVASWLVALGVGRLGPIGAATEGITSKSTPPSTQTPSKKLPASPAPNTSSKSSQRELPRIATTPNKSLMDDDNSQDVVVEDIDDPGISDSEVAEAPEDEVGEPVTAEMPFLQNQGSRLSSPLPRYSAADDVTESCWSTPKDSIFNVRGPKYLTDRVKMPSGDASFICQGVDMWMTDNPERHIARHPSVMGGQLANIDQDIFMVNFLLPFGNFVAYFSVPPLEEFSNPQLAGVWTRFIEGDQQYRDARLKLLPVVVDGPWIVRAAVPGTSPALLGKVIPLQYYFTHRQNGQSIYEVDVIITASSIAKGILSVVKGHAKALSIALAFIIEAAEEHELPETVLASFQINSLHLEDCPLLPDCDLDAGLD